MSLFDSDKTTFIPQNNNLINYYYFDKVFPEEMLKKFDEQLEKLNPDKALHDANVSGIINREYRSSKILWIPRSNEWKWLYEFIGSLVKTANDKMWKFDITHMNEQIQYTEYDEDYEGHYDWHMDIGSNKSSMRKISISIQLSAPEEYEGGKLQFFYKKDILTAPTGKGTAVLFPSFFMHKVTPLTKGKRRCLVLWVSGPPLS